MQLGGPPRPGPVPHEVATAIRDGAARSGHRPAITQLLPEGRQEQSVASLAQWAAKGAHLLELEFDLGPGDRILLDAPLGWTTAAVVLGAWWAGVGVTLTPDPDVEVAVVHASRASHLDAVGEATELFWLGDGIDGAPVGGRPLERGEAWAHAAQPFPDQPPPPRASPACVAVVAGTRSTTQQELLELATTLGDDVTLGMERGSSAAASQAHDATLDLALLCLRPLLSGRASVVLRDVERERADGERIGRWT